MNDLTFHNPTDHWHTLEGWTGRTLMLTYDVPPQSIICLTPTPHYALPLDWVYRPQGTTGIRMLPAC